MSFAATESQHVAGERFHVAILSVRNVLPTVRRVLARTLGSYVGDRYERMSEASDAQPRQNLAGVQLGTGGVRIAASRIDLVYLYLRASRRASLRDHTAWAPARRLHLRVSFAILGKFSELMLSQMSCHTKS